MRTRNHWDLDGYADVNDTPTGTLDSLDISRACASVITPFYSRCLGGLCNGMFASVGRVAREQCFQLRVRGHAPAVEHRSLSNSDPSWSMLSFALLPRPECFRKSRTHQSSRIVLVPLPSIAELWHAPSILGLTVLKIHRTRVVPEVHGEAAILPNKRRMTGHARGVR
jgi:hypothetical protein